MLVEVKLTSRKLRHLGLQSSPHKASTPLSVICEHDFTLNTFSSGYANPNASKTSSVQDRQPLRLIDSIQRRFLGICFNAFVERREQFFSES